MIFSSTIVGPLDVNCYILACEETREGIVVDPGDDADTILQLVADRDLNIVEIVATHGHFDHIGRRPDPLAWQSILRLVTDNTYTTSITITLHHI